MKQRPTPAGSFDNIIERQLRALIQAEVTLQVEAAVVELRAEIKAQLEASKSDRMIYMDGLAELLGVEVDAAKMRVRRDEDLQRLMLREHGRIAFWRSEVVALLNERRRKKNARFTP